MPAAKAQTRITAGEFRGRLVLTPRGQSVRPTTALVRKALFDILGDQVLDATMVDLYAGAGTVGFEALSRGAASVLFVERHRGASELITRTAEQLGCAHRCRTVNVDVPTWLRRRPAELAGADICFLDAPYRDDAGAMIELIGIAPPRLVVCEHHRATSLPEVAGRLRRMREATYGATRLTFWQRAPDKTGGDDDDDTGDGEP
jgi:16S rRNA (guanine966-N2)-methyltransferase